MKIEEFNNKYQKTILNTQKNMQKKLKNMAWAQGTRISGNVQKMKS